MNIQLLVIGKTDKTHIKTGIEEYVKRINRYCKFEIKIIKDIKNSKKMSESVQKKLEGEKIIAEVSTSDQMVLLDEKGKQTNSKDFAVFLNKTLVSGAKNLIFVIGGPYGFSEEVYKRANAKISLSKMTFSHQLVRIIFAEQLYRAFSILNNEPYHHD
ncbi:MAG: 23S rRNA (pseudouridine(1915)-N(3))-methyltransferase RlmH [Bacteroidales bacterium]|nr:23S rRNA (pseudouridine(1915)-N(3))-methyltransferase RlmH [Bacteroidales bacterium]MDD4216007.1 23S rRNA (pseudouridine(1915)-N(3))-methyltransferase RlmH [Bacteroidales bacterium]MDY0140302.1 23S rRNA (pseudouridine(1915)-N(3))-methyltransferase RlmH [Bacteroidales bacterium]